MSADLKTLVIEEFSGETAQQQYRKNALNGLWIAEKHFFGKHFTLPGARILDIGCGTGRTTMPLARMGFRMTGVDLVPAMVSNAKAVAGEQGLDLDYREGDACALDFPDGSFDYALFSNQGWTQIPGRDNRLRALLEAHRVLKKGGIFIFTAHPRTMDPRWLPHWALQWIKVRVLKPAGLPVAELDFGDRFFTRESTGRERTYKTRQYIHIPSQGEVLREIRKTPFEIMEADGSLQISATDVRKHPPVFFVCRA